MEVPFVSIVIPVLNGAGTLGDLLRSLNHLEYPAGRLEVLIVDNGSDDGSAEMAQAAGYRVLVEPHRGASRARNAGVAQAGGEIIAFTDADCILSRGWLSALVAPFGDPAIGGVGGRTETYLPKTAAERHAARIRHLDGALHLSHPTFPFAPTANAAFRKSVFDRIGGFDPDFQWGEPIDFCKRLVRDTGWKLAYAPKAVVLHKARSTVSDFYRQQRGYGYSLAMLCSKYRNEVHWDWKKDLAADWQVLRAGLLVPFGVLESAALRRKRDAVESRSMEFVRQLGRRAGFLRAVRERSLHL
jgi:cellulose synthase/poly-beta-1,6-N-acetylglucosamine synthase-like glycosyltransferase